MARYRKGWIVGLAYLFVTPAVGQRPVAPPLVTAGVQYTAPDYTYSVWIPSNWFLGPASCVGWAPKVETVSIYSQYGESFTAGVYTVSLNPGHALARMQAFQQLACPAEVLELARRSAGPELQPVEIITRFLPWLSQGALQLPQILFAHSFSPDGQSNAAVIFYGYVLAPQQDRPFMSVAVPPALWNRPPVNMLGVAVVSTSPATPLAPYWKFTFIGASAPQGIFAKNGVVYQKILQSFNVNTAVYGQMVQQQGDIIAAWSAQALASQARSLQQHEQWDAAMQDLTSGNYRFEGADGHEYPFSVNDIPLGSIGDYYACGPGYPKLEVHGQQPQNCVHLTPKYPR